MGSSTRYRQVDVSGPPRALGRQIGEACREEIRGFAAIALERVNKTVRVSRDRALAVAAGCIPLVEEYSPAMLEELHGMAESSGVPLEELMLLQVRNQLQADVDAGCTAFALAPRRTAGQRAVVAQNWDNDPALDPFTVVLTRRPEGKPALMTVTQAGLIAYIGCSDAGIGVCLNTLPAPSRPYGVPHYFTVRGLFEARSLDGAVQAVQRARRAIPANILLSTPQGPADLEVTVDAVHVLKDPGSGLVAHTNHCLHPALAAVNERFPELIQSRPRLERIYQLLEEAPSPLGRHDLEQALRDHEGYPTSICRHANDHPASGFWTSVFSVIIEPQEGVMHLSRGNPCQQPYETYALN